MHADGTVIEQTKEGLVGIRSDGTRYDASKEPWQVKLKDGTELSDRRPSRDLSPVKDQRPADYAERWRYARSKGWTVDGQANFHDAQGRFVDAHGQLIEKSGGVTPGWRENADGTKSRYEFTGRVTEARAGGEDFATFEWKYQKGEPEQLETLVTSTGSVVKSDGPGKWAITEADPVKLGESRTTTFAGEIKVQADGTYSVATANSPLGSVTRQTNGKLQFERSGSEIDLTANAKGAFDQTTVAGGRFTVIKDGHLVEVVPLPEGKLRLGTESVDGPGFLARDKDGNYSLLSREQLASDTTPFDDRSRHRFELNKGELNALRKQQGPSAVEAAKGEAAKGEAAAPVKAEAAALKGSESAETPYPTVARRLAWDSQTGELLTAEQIASGAHKLAEPEEFVKRAPVQAEIIDKPFYWVNTNSGQIPVDKAPIELANIGDLKIRETIKETVDGKVVESESFYVAGRVFREGNYALAPSSASTRNYGEFVKTTVIKAQKLPRDPHDPNRVYQVVNKKGALSEGRAEYEVTDPDGTKRIVSDYLVTDNDGGQRIVAGDNFNLLNSAVKETAQTRVTLKDVASGLHLTPIAGTEVDLGAAVGSPSTTMCTATT